MKNLTLCLLLIGSSLWVQAQNFADQLISAGPCQGQVALICPSGVQDAGNVVDGNLATFARMRSNLGLSLIENSAFVEVGFSNPGIGGEKIVLVFNESNANLGADVLQNLVVSAFDESGQEVANSEGNLLSSVGLLSGEGSPSILEITTEPGNYTFNKVRVELNALVSLAQEVALFAVYTERACPGIAADEVLGAVAVNNPGFAVDEDPQTAATLSLPLALGNTASLELGLPVPANAGDYVGFKVKKESLALGLGVIENLKISALDSNGNVLDEMTDFSFADLTALNELAPVLGTILGLGGTEQGNAVIGFYTGSDIAGKISRLKIEVAPLVGVSVDIQVFGGFFFSSAYGLNVSASPAGIVSGQTSTLTAGGDFAAYVWNNGQVGRSIEVNEPGLYTVSGIRFDGCEVKSSILLRDLSCGDNNSNTPSEILATGDCNPISLLICPSGVENAENAIDGDPDSFATLSSTLGLNIIESKAFIKMGFDANQAPGTIFNFNVKALNQDLNADLVDNMSVEFFNEEDSSVFRKEDLSLTDVQLLSGEEGLIQISVVTPIGNYSIKSVQFEIEAVLNVLQEIALYDVYTTCACPAIDANQVVASQNASEVNNLTDNNPNNFATLDLPLGITNDAFIEVKFPGKAEQGDFVGFVIAAGNDLLSAGVIDNLNVDLLDESGVVVASNSDFTLADLVAAEQVGGVLGSLLGVGSSGVAPYILGVSVPVGNTKVSSARITLSPTIGLLNSVRVYKALYQTRTQGISISGSSLSTCALQPVTLSAPEGFVQYLWSTGETTREINTDVPGLYTVTVSKENGCSVSGSFLVQSAQIKLEPVVTEPNCNQSNGSVTVNVPGLSGPFTYLWSNGATTASLSNIPSGIYEVTVTDQASGCSGSLTIPVSDIDAPKFASWLRHPNCGSSDGAIYLTLPSGASVQWSNGRQTPIIKNLNPGFYTAIVTFADGCKRIETYRLIDRTDFGLDPQVTPSDCDNPSGIIALNISLPGDYIFEWSNGATSQIISGLAPGIYSVLVTNVVTRCMDIAHVAVSAVGAPDVTFNLQEEICAREENGFIEAIINSVDPVDIEWNLGQTTPRIENLGPGLYTVRITSAAGCDGFFIIPLEARDSLVSTLSSTASFCEPPYDGTANAVVAGGRTPYNFLWNNGEAGQGISAIRAGVYNLRIEDANGCIITRSIEVAETGDCKSDPGPGPENPMDVGTGDINNIFTPNNDGFNDNWVLGINLDLFDAVRLTVVNIYGNEVFNSSDYQNNWNGTFKNSGDLLPDGAYYYRITLVKGSSSKELASYVMIKR